MRYIVTTPWWLRLTFPSGLTWSLPNQHNHIYITFDDGPHPEITPFVLEQLQQFNAKATFFCIGNNVKQWPQVYQQILANGHQVGNHTQHHKNGGKTNDEEWLNDVKEAARWIDSDLFRPPYGRIRSFPAKILQKAQRPYRIIMWSVLSADFDTRLSAKDCVQHIVKHTKPGSILVFHDSEKAWPRLQAALPEVLQRLTDKGFIFKAIE